MKTIEVKGFPSKEKLAYAEELRAQVGNCVLINPIEIVKSMYGYYDFDLENTEYISNIVNEILMQCLINKMNVVYYANKDLKHIGKMVDTTFENMNFKTAIQKDQQQPSGIGKINLQKIYDYDEK